jgi:hypothetical protein
VGNLRLLLFDRYQCLIRGGKVVRKGKAAKKRFHIGKPTGRVSGIQRLEKLTEKYVAEGMSLGEARNKARARMRANPRRHWRAG